MKRALVLCCVIATSAAASAAPQEMGPPFDMRITACERSPSGFLIRTTGAVFRIDPRTGSIVFSQRLVKSRDLGRVCLSSVQLNGLRIDSEDQETVVLVAEAGLRLEVHCDSVLRLDAPMPLPVTIQGDFAPEYFCAQTGATMALDKWGGMGAYFWSRHPRGAEVQRTDAGFRIWDELPPGHSFLLCVCPPREYDWQRHNQERIVHFFPEESPHGGSPRPLPTDEELARWRAIANVLVLHLEAWDGFGLRHIRPRDPPRFRQVIAKAHKLGFLVLPYSSTYYYNPARAPDELFVRRWRPDAVDLYIEEAQWLLQEYGVDGLYWDGIFNDPLKAWRCARRMRKLLGKRRLYVHCTYTPLHRQGVYLPFADTYADYILRGEGHSRRRVDPIYLRYEVSGYNISNAIGTLCHDTCRVDQTMFDWALQANARIPYWPGFQVHKGRRYFLSPREDKLYQEYYLPRIHSVRGPDDYAALSLAGAQSRKTRREQLAQAHQKAEQALAEHLIKQRGATANRSTGNLAAFRTPTCSQYVSRWEGPHGLGYRPEYATDLEPETFWGADHAPQWLTVDLGEVTRISRVRVITYFGDHRYYHYRVEVSPDGYEWRTVGAKLDNSPATAEGMAYRFEPCRARFVRVVLLKNSRNIGLHIGELEVYQ